VASTSIGGGPAGAQPQANMEAIIAAIVKILMRISSSSRSGVDTAESSRKTLRFRPFHDQYHSS